MSWNNLPSIFSIISNEVPLDSFTTVLSLYPLPLLARSSSFRKVPPILSTSPLIAACCTPSFSETIRPDIRALSSCSPLNSSEYSSCPLSLFCLNSNCFTKLSLFTPRRALMSGFSMLNSPVLFVADLICEGVSSKTRNTSPINSSSPSS